MALRHALVLAILGSSAAYALDEEVTSCGRAVVDGDAQAGSCIGCHASRSGAAARGAIDGDDPSPPDANGLSCGLDFLGRDAPSERCLSCHMSGRGAPSIRPHASHPYDIPYRGGGFGQRRLKSEDHVRARLRLPRGLVTCTTCHSNRSRLSHRTARPLDGDDWQERLYNVCHLLDDDEGRIALNGR